MQCLALHICSICLLGRLATCHSWVEQLCSIFPNGSYVGPYGYPRGYVPRSASSFADGAMRYMLPSANSNRTFIDETDLVCAPTQRIANQTDGFPSLRASPGDYVALKYLENGHVTIPENQPNKAWKSGRIYVYGTSAPRLNERLFDVLAWNANGTGGDKRGRLLSSQPFDDGRCYEINERNISQARQREFPNKSSSGNSTVAQWCEGDIQLPIELRTNTTYTLYWIWNWFTLPRYPDSIRGNDELYTTCVDVALTQAIASNVQDALQQQDPQRSAVPNYKERAASC